MKKKDNNNDKNDVNLNGKVEEEGGGGGAAVEGGNSPSTDPEFSNFVGEVTNFISDIHVDNNNNNNNMNNEIVNVMHFPEQTREIDVPLDKEDYMDMISKIMDYRNKINSKREFKKEYVKQLDGEISSLEGDILKLESIMSTYKKLVEVLCSVTITKIKDGTHIVDYIEPGEKEPHVILHSKRYKPGESMPFYDRQLFSSDGDSESESDEPIISEEVIKTGKKEDAGDIEFDL
jgi:hypothetical protein